MNRSFKTCIQTRCNEEKTVKFTVAKAYWPSMKRHWISWVVTLVTLAVATGLAGVAPQYLKGIVDTFTSNAPDVLLAKAFFFKMVLVVVARQVLMRIFDLGLTVHEARVMMDLDRRSLYHIQRQSTNFFEDTYSGSLITKARRLRASYEGIMDLFFFQFGQQILMILVIGFVFYTNLPSLILPFIVWALSFVGYSVVTTRWKYPYDIDSAEKDSRVGAALADTLTNHMAVKTFGQEVAEERRFGSVVETSYQARMKAWIRGNIIMVGQWLIMGVGELGFVWLMISGWEQKIITAGDFVFAQTFVVWATTYLGTFGQSLRRLFTAIADAEEMAEIYQLVPEVRDAPSARNLVLENGEIEFHAVSFSYRGAKAKDEHAVHNFSLNIPAGKSVGLVGRSGAGKSTLVKLSLRLHDIDSGYIRIDGQDIANVTQNSLRQQLAVVPQHPQLFHRTIRDNIAFGTPNASEDEIINAAKQAYAWEFIEKLPDKLDTMVGERGVKLSGGQQQRVAIARAILADPRILILDEATSALDSETEKLIQGAIANLLEHRTAIVIAHRLSTIMRLNQIVVMDGGRIVETGTHKKLLGLNGRYANLWNHQTGGYIN